MNTWQQRIESCIENDSNRQYLKGIPLELICATEYNPPWWYWIDYLKCNNN